MPVWLWRQGRFEQRTVSGKYFGIIENFSDSHLDRFPAPEPIRLAFFSQAGTKVAGPNSGEIDIPPDASEVKYTIDELPLAGGSLYTTLRDRVGVELGKPLRPEAVHFVTAIPKTRNAKVMRRVIRAAWMGDDPGDTSALENPQSVDTIRSARNTT